MDLIQRLKTFLESRGIGVTQFADECSIPRPTASQLLAGRNKKVSDEMIGKIHQVYPELSILWLMFGEGNMLLHNPHSGMEMQPPTPVGHDSYYIPATPQDAFDFGSKTIPNSSGIRPGNDGDPNSNSQTRSQAAVRPAVMTQQTFSFSSGGSSASPQTTPPSSPNSGEAKRRKVTGVVVYYDDNTFDSFLPDPNLDLPFVAKS